MFDWFLGNTELVHKLFPDFLYRHHPDWRYHINSWRQIDTEPETYTTELSPNCPNELNQLFNPKLSIKHIYGGVKNVPTDYGDGRFVAVPISDTKNINNLYDYPTYHSEHCHYEPNPDYRYFLETQVK